MSFKRFKQAVLIGRFEPLHNGHLANFMQGLDIADEILILVGSSFQPRTPKNPFTFDERKKMIEGSLKRGRPLDNVTIHPLEDFKYSNNSWIAEVQRIVKTQCPGVLDKDVAILGYDKDESSWYNHAFPSWTFVPLEGFVEHGRKPIDATTIRNLMFEGQLDYLTGAMPPFAFEFVRSWCETQHYKDMVEEYVFYKEYHKKWEAAPFVPIFHTTDAVVIQGGHILLIQRGYSPGKGLWALPGGFLNPNEFLDDGVIRELIEETKIKVPEIILRKSVTYSRCFDHPDRDLRGRTITNAYLIELTGGDGTLPRVKGSDDARRAEWFKLSDIETMGPLIYSDHKHIIDIMVARATK